MDRRTFFTRAAAVTATTMAAGRAAAAPAKAGKGGAAQKALPFKISLAQWSLHQSIHDKKVEHLDFAKIASGFGIDAIEYVNSFFKERARDKAYLAEMKRRAVGEGVWSSLIMVDGEGKL